MSLWLGWTELAASLPRLPTCSLHFLFSSSSTSPDPTMWRVHFIELPLGRPPQRLPLSSFVVWLSSALFRPHVPTQNKFLWLKTHLLIAV